MTRLSAFVITKNEEENIGACLESLRFADEIVVLDSGSVDKTAQLARGYTGKVFNRAFDDFSSQKNAAVGHCSGEWVLCVDADERVDRALADEIRRVIERPRADAYRIRRRTNLFGRDFRFSGLQKDRPIRLFRRDRARFVNPVHEELTVSGAVSELQNTLKHRSFQKVGEHLRRLRLYTALEPAPKNGAGRSLLARPAGRFYSIYVAGQGFRDGFEGFLYAVLSAYYEFVRLAKCRETEILDGRKR